MTARHASRPLVIAVVETLAALGVTLAVAELIGLREVGRAFDHLQPGWLAAAGAAQLLSVLGYVGAYRGVVTSATGRRLPGWLTLELVLTGFGPFTVAGGFQLDRRSLQRLGVEPARALRSVLDLGGVEFLTLVWIAFAAALVALLAEPALPGSLVWPWLLAVPIGTAIAVAIARAVADDTEAAHRPFVAGLISGLHDVLGLARHPLRARVSWTSILAYWAFDMATLYATLRMFGLRPAPESLVLAYATGYLLSRRTLPLGGAGFVTALLTFSLYWVHLPLAASLAAVGTYRGVSFLLAAAPAAVSRVRLAATLDGAQRSEV